MFSSAFSHCEKYVRDTRIYLSNYAYTCITENSTYEISCAYLPPSKSYCYTQKVVNTTYEG